MSWFRRASTQLWPEHLDRQIQVLVWTKSKAATQLATRRTSPASAKQAQKEQMKSTLSVYGGSEWAVVGLEAGPELLKAGRPNAGRLSLGNWSRFGSGGYARISS